MARRGFWEVSVPSGERGSEPAVPAVGVGAAAGVPEAPVKPFPGLCKGKPRGWTVLQDAGLVFPITVHTAN